MGRPPKLTLAQQAEARRRRAEGATLAELARSYGVGKSTISRLSQYGRRPIITLYRVWGHSAMPTVDYKEALYRRELRIDCTNITLTQNTDQNPLSFTGNGYIHQQPDGTLYLYMYARPSDEGAAHALFRISAMANLVARDKYFSLRAIAYGGDEWTCDSVRAEPDAYGRELIIRGRLYEIRRVESSPEGTSPFFLEVQIYQELDFQHMSFVKTVHDFGSENQRRLSTFQTRFGSCEARSLGDRFFWHVSSQGAMPDNLHDLAVAALEFLAAKTVVPRLGFAVPGQTAGICELDQ